MKIDDSIYEEIFGKVFHLLILLAAAIACLRILANSLLNIRKPRVDLHQSVFSYFSMF